MRNSKILRRIAGVLLLVLLLAGAETLLSRLLTPVSFSVYYHRDEDRLAESGENVDLVFLGSSHMYRTMDPDVYEEKMSLDNVWVASGSGIQLAGSYYLLKRVLDRYTPRWVVLNVNVNTVASSMTSNSLVARDFTRGTDRLLFTLENFDLSDAAYLLNSYRYRNNLEADKMAENWQDWAAVEQGQIPPNSMQQYERNGFVYSGNAKNQGNIEASPATLYEYDEKREAALDRIAQMCRQKGCELILLTAPTSVENLLRIEGYQEMHDYYDRYAAERGLTYFDLNLLEDREDFLPDTMMHDSNHVNGEGAQIISGMFSDILTEYSRGEDTSHWFYPDYDAFAQTVKRVAGVSARAIRGDATVTLTLDSAQNNTITPEYEVIVTETETGNRVAYSPYGTQQTRTLTDLPRELAAYTLWVNARTLGSEAEQEAWMEYPMARGSKLWNKKQNTAAEE